MRNANALRRYASYAGILVAAAASVATASPIPVDMTPSRSGDDTLTADKPEVTRHITVRSGHDHKLEVKADIDWGSVSDTSQAQVLVQLTGGSADKSDEETVFFTDYIANNKNLLVAQADAAVEHPCASSPCEQVYTLLMRLGKGTIDEPVPVHWEVTASRIGADLSGDLTVEVEEEMK